MRARERDGGIDREKSVIQRRKERESERGTGWPGSVSACLTPGDFTASPRSCKIGQDWGSNIHGGARLVESQQSSFGAV